MGLHIYKSCIFKISNDFLLSVGADEADDPAAFLRGLRANYADIPVVLVTESVDPDTLAPMIGSSLRACHRKPLSLDGLLADIEAACR